MFRITMTLKAGHDTQSVVFIFGTESLASAIMAGMTAMTQLGFKPEDYDIAHSLNLA